MPSLVLGIVIRKWDEGERHTVAIYAFVRREKDGR